jgi:hypothetical protein
MPISRRRCETAPAKRQGGGGGALDRRIGDRDVLAEGAESAYWQARIDRAHGAVDRRGESNGRAAGPHQHHRPGAGIAIEAAPEGRAGPLAQGPVQRRARDADHHEQRTIGGLQAEPLAERGLVWPEPLRKHRVDDGGLFRSGGVRGSKLSTLEYRSA